MARTIAQIQQSIIDAKTADSTLGPLLTSSSAVAIWNLWTYVVAFCQWTLETLFDAHVAEVTGIIATQKPHSLQWYVTKAKAFQFGASLPSGSDTYDPVALSGDPSLVVTYAAAVEFTNLVRIKVATGSIGTLSALSSGQLTAFTGYMARVKDAGVRLQCTSGPADIFQPSMVIYYDPLVLDNTGARLDGTAPTPVMDAVNSFLNGLPFNGRFILDSFIAAMQAVPGVEIADITNAQAYYGATPPVTISTWYVPDAGYMTLDNTWFTANVSYVAYS
jgi:hypothetical protein